MRYQLNLSIRYDFDRPAGGGRQLLRVVPMALPERQSLEHLRLEIEPKPLEHHVFTDFFGTETHELVMAPGLTGFSVELKAEVERKALGGGCDKSAKVTEMAALMGEVRDLGPLSPWHYLAASPRIPAVAEIADFARASAPKDASAQQLVEAIGQAIFHYMSFDATVTDAYTGVKEAFEGRRGVCQDYAQIMIAALRALGVPAAYAAGYLRTYPPPGQPRLQGADAMHAWVRAWAGPEAGWIDYDPTNACWVDEDHILVGFGRDYSDVAPVTGSLRLDGAQTGFHSVDIAEMR